MAWEGYRFYCLWVERPGEGVDPEREQAKRRVAFESWLAGVQHNALALPESEFEVWLENPNLLEGYYVSDNIKIRHPEEIEAYRDGSVPVVHDVSSENVWARVDTLRLMILKRSVEELRGVDGLRKVAYFDGDVDLDNCADELSAMVDERLQLYGVAAGCANVKLNKWEIEAGGSLENGFMASMVDGKFIDDHLPEILSEVNEAYALNLRKDYGNKMGMNTVYDIYYEHLRRYASNMGIPHHIWEKRMGGVPIQPPSGKKFQRDISVIKKEDHALWASERREIDPCLVEELETTVSP